MAKKTKKVTKAKPSKLKSALKVGAGVVGAAALGVAAVKGYKALKGGKGKRRGKKSAVFYAREIMRLKLKKRYDKLRLSI